MSNRSRGLRETVISGLAKVGLVWAVAVLGAMFMAMSSQGLGSQHAAAMATSSPGAPSTAGVTIALTLLGAGLTVLAIGASRGDSEPQRRVEPEPEPTADLSLALGLGLFG